MKATADSASLQKLEHDPASAEILWGLALGGDEFRLRNVPIWAYGLGLDDIVEAKLQDDKRYHVTRLVQCSGLLTVRIAGPDAPRSIFENLIGAFSARAVATENFSKSYSAFSITSTNFNALLPLVEDAEETGVIFVEVANDDCEEDPTEK